MNDYEAKQQARREHYLQRADDATAESGRRYAAFRQIVESIPMGQPILVGHHSERGHRAAIKRMDRHMAASIEADNRAKHYRDKAAAVGTGGISSDDPEAVQKLQAQLEAAELKQESMKAVNRIIHGNPRNQPTPEKLAALVALGMSEGSAARLFEPDFCGRVGFPDYALSNNSANIRRIRQRVEQLQAAAGRATVAEDRGGIQYREEDNRVRLVFPGKPAREVRDTLKAHGFRWSPTAGAWQRHLNNAGRYAAEQVLKALAA